MKKIITGLATWLFFMCMTGMVNAAIIDFENTGLNEFDVLTNQIAGVTFSGAQIFKEGDPAEAFSGDTVTGGEPFGGYFISDLDISPNNNPNPIDILFDSPVFNVSFVVADIDEEEGIFATIYDINNKMLDSQTLLAGDPLAGDNIGTLISFNETNISRLLITPIPSSDGGIGWGVDNISYETMPPVPEPDADNDTIPDSTDNCPDTYNLDQTDTDSDGQGDVCDPYPYDSDNEARFAEDLAQAQADLAQCDADLAQSTNDLTQCEADLAQCLNPPEILREGKGKTYSDNSDNDNDGLVDCLDPDCARNKACR